MSMELFKNHGVPIILPSPENFLLVKETLTRIGVASKKDKTLWPSVCVLHKRGFYHIMHFKEMFMLDGRESDLSANDIGRRNTIALLLYDWGLIDLDEKVKETLELNTVDMSQIKIVPFKEKSEWILSPKYFIGNTKKFNS